MGGYPLSPQASRDCIPPPAGDGSCGPPEVGESGTGARVQGLDQDPGVHRLRAVPGPMAPQMGGANTVTRGSWGNLLVNLLIIWNRLLAIDHFISITLPCGYST